MRKTRNNGKNKTHVYLFRMNGCPYCEMMMPAWKEIRSIRSNADEIFHEIERQHFSDSMLNRIKKKVKSPSEKENVVVQGYPTLFAIRDGKLFNHSGERDKSSLIHWLDKIKQHGGGDNIMMGGWRYSSKKSSYGTAKKYTNSKRKSSSSSKSRRRSYRSRRSN